ncbi:MAG: MBL fold metallo-hydrolase, partial [Clostridia bacterium]|nr:MBL fold metallo-hydrolase [Clostridia bacterium]
MTRFCTLFSGSSGNAVYLSTDQGSILIDCGMSGRQTLDAIRQNGLSPEELKAILITHEHSDHVKGAGILAR